MILLHQAQCLVHEAGHMALGIVCPLAQSAAEIRALDFNLQPVVPMLGVVSAGGEEEFLQFDDGSRQLSERRLLDDDGGNQEYGLAVPFCRNEGTNFAKRHSGDSDLRLCDHGNTRKEFRQRREAVEKPVDAIVSIASIMEKSDLIRRVLRQTRPHATEVLQLPQGIVERFRSALPIQNLPSSKAVAELSLESGGTLLSRPLPCERGRDKRVPPEVLQQAHLRRSTAPRGTLPDETRLIEMRQPLAPFTGTRQFLRIMSAMKVI